MECGLVGLPGIGKTTLFSALTGSQVAGYSDKPNLGIAHIPDPRLGDIAAHITTRKIIQATIQLTDIAGVPPGSDGKKINAFLEHVRQVDALCHVVRAADFGGLGAPDPAADIEALDTELVLADLVVVDSALDRAKRTARTGEKEAKERVALLEKLHGPLEEGRPVRAMAGDLAENEHRIIKSYGLVTAKPVLYVANVDEDDVAGESAAAKAVFAHAEASGGEAVALCAKLEAELAELDDADRAEMLESLGLAEPAVGPLARALARLLGLAYFYTAGEKEVRAWIIGQGATAPEAAGVIHSDLQRGFIRAECYHVSELTDLKSEKAIREAGKLRSEGKNYVMKDGDVVHFLFNV